MKVSFKPALVATVLGLVAVSGAHAAPVDLTALTTAFDMSTTISAIMAVAAILAGVFVAIRATKTILGMIKGR
jgi:2-methylaconitate cis-trans-isomerase PrpF